MEESTRTSGQSLSPDAPVGRKYPIGEATKIDASGPGSIVVTRALKGLATAFAHPEDQDRIQIEAKGDTLKIDFKGGLLLNRGPKEEIRYEVAIMDLQEVKLSDGIVAQIAAGETKSFKCKVSDGSRATVSNLRASSFEADLSDGSQLTVAGAVEKSKIKCADGSSYQGDALASEEAEIEASDGSQATLRVRARLKARADGGASVGYLGDTVKLDAKTDETGNIRQIGHA